MLVVAKALGARPGTAFCLSDQAPTGGTQRHAVFTRENVGADPSKPEGESSASCGAVQERASVFGAIRAEPSDFRCFSIVAHSGDGSADNCHADKITTRQGTERKEVADDGLMMTVQASNELVRFHEADSTMREVAHFFLLFITTTGTAR